ncbi:TetR/AcrR family transcriptional regulator [Mumia sp.]|uniref:TetR/AcrR family transcriptional regulator n=1 Tax=Mumia sp. TaxID=1965300 RepID=UPI0026091A5C|nr:TetR/AcrR family transcriptional regulator [Mumia sp.]MDD9347685.1 TetR/AcrR family transcriptional regulator [Mumia sp.]
MAIHERRAREREARERLIIDVARELAEAEGWEAVTTRRLAERVEYSQPVLYSHFAGMGALMAAVAMEGFTEIAEALLRAVRTPEVSPSERLADVATAYLDFGARHPALYDAMFSRAVELKFAQESTPAPMREGFGALREAVRPYVGDDADADVDALTEVFWSCLHGLVTLAATGRLNPALVELRLTALVERFSR